MKKDNKEPEFNLEVYLSEVAATMVNEMFTIVQEEAGKHGDEFAASLALSILKNTVFVLVYNSLANAKIPDNASSEEAEHLVRLSFATMKDGIQNTIADAFESASNRFSGQNLGYYCKILTAGPPANTLEI